jgi:multimeric flavodoxin WrbA
MKILGISASRRNWGNTDILVRHALKGAESKGAETQFLRLTDFSIQQCRGCLKCLFKERDCVIDDQLVDILAAMRSADGIVLGSPIHCLSASGTLQTLLPRLFRQQYTGEFREKSSIALAIGGKPGWEGWALAQVVSFLLILGMRPIDQLIGYGQGPGEIFYDKNACQRSIDAGRRIAANEITYSGDQGTCPFCHLDLVIPGKEGEPRCMVCNISGRWTKRGTEKRFTPFPELKPGWYPDRNREHFANMILSSKNNYHNKIKEIKSKLTNFKNENTTPNI